jgi:hypothetical protein
MSAALVISPWLEGWFLPALFASAGISCDVVTACPVFRLSACCRRLCVVPSASHLVAEGLQCVQQYGPYDWVIPASDSLLGEIVQRSALHASYRELMPLAVDADPSHLNSKIGLSRLLSAVGLSTPPWRVAHDSAGVLEAGFSLGLPVLIKLDASSGGQGIRQCQTIDDLEAAAADPLIWPCLIQAQLRSPVYSVEALFCRSRLVCFSVSRMLATVSEFGPSAARCYGLPEREVPDLHLHLQRLGVALGLHGFANISFVYPRDSQVPCFFECDARPNAWIGLDWSLGGDFARHLQRSLMQRFDLLTPSQPELCYPNLMMHEVAPFFSRGEAVEEEQQSGRFVVPPNEASALFDAVFQSGQLHRALDFGT